MKVVIITVVNLVLLERPVPISSTSVKVVETRIMMVDGVEHDVVVWT